ncbi:hypothetical protein [Brevibacillus reuszeri]|uniref:hypothetical protein n=1 Tax=Brevibacillus reuszeri TaxID=54915 RepID=UPI000A909B72|nr:hypothetical protein [Brevibacillus reuszeri]MED1856760.1 hypothetical protein [Brevibacillus reuszeri]
MSKIKKVLDVTGKLFDLVDFTEATLFFHGHRQLPETITIETWGLSFIETQNTKDYYVSGIATISFEGVTSGLLEVSLYQPNGKDFIKIDYENCLKLTKSWGKPLNFEEYQYHLGGVLDWPKGYCQLGIHATGKVTVSFDTDDCVLTRDYVLNPEKYTYMDSYFHHFPL